MQANTLNLDKKAWFSFDAVVPISKGLSNIDANSFLENCANVINVTFKIYDDGKTEDLQIKSYERKINKIIDGTGYRVIAKKYNARICKYRLERV